VLIKHCTVSIGHQIEVYLHPFQMYWEIRKI